MTPSTATRERAAELHTAWRDAEDEIWEAEDSGVSGERLFSLEEDADEKRDAYRRFAEDSNCLLMEDVCGLHLRCARTGLPLVVWDQIKENANNDIYLVEKVDAA